MFGLFFKQKTAYEMRISDWSSDVCSSDLSRRSRRSWKRARFSRFFSVRNGLSGVGPAKAIASWRPMPPCGAAAKAGVERIAGARRSEDRRGGKECVRPCRYRWSQYPYKKKTTTHTSNHKTYRENTN